MCRERALWEILMSHALHLGNQLSRMSAYCDSHEIITGFGEALGISTSLEGTCEVGEGEMMLIPGKYAS